jgi:predicted exporter
MPAKRLTLLAWLIVVAASGLLVVRAPLRTDMGAFLPRSSTLGQQALTDQVNNGATSRLIILAITGAPTPVLAELSKAVALQLRSQPSFIDISNGDSQSFADVQQFVWSNRYLLGDDITADRFTATGLHVALQNDLGLLSSDMGMLLEASLPSDPTNEMFTLINQLEPTSRPHSQDGVWVSGDGSDALLLVHTNAPGFDIDGQQRALLLIQSAFDNARADIPAANRTRLLETGPGVFGVNIRNTTKSDVTRLSIVAMTGAICLLLFAYRSPRVLLLGLLPVASGALAAVAAVFLDFGFVHGVTLGFGITLIGESLDYAIYLFTQTLPGDSPRDTLMRIWPTLRLGAAASVVGFGAMLFSSFVGFAQLGLFSIVGLIVAACVTRFVLPHLIPAGFAASGTTILARPVLAIIRYRRQFRPLVALMVFAGSAAILTHRGGLWDTNLADLSPIPADQQALDTRLRYELGVPDFRYFAVFRAGSEQQALEESEVLAPNLQNMEASHQISGFDLPTTTLPSNRTQSLRQAALPDDKTLRTSLSRASAGLPFRYNLFDPFFVDVAKEKAAPRLTQASLPRALALQVQSMLLQDSKSWVVIAPLSGVSDPARVAAAIASTQLHDLEFVDLNQQSDQLLRTFQRDASMLASFGSLAILVVLFLGLRSPLRVAAVVAPLVAAVIATASILTFDGGKLSIFMVVGFLLIIAVGSNYCLFFERSEHNSQEQERSVASIALANLCTVCAYGLMSLSHIPVLHDIGMTVALGTLLSLLFGAALSSGDLHEEPELAQKRGK